MYRSKQWLAVAALAAGTLAGSAAVAQSSGVSAVWAGEGGDKVLQHERRAASGAMRNSVWDGTKITLFGARNEVVNFNLVIESQNGTRDLSVAFNRLQGPGGAVISSVPATGDGVFVFTNRNIELFVVRYLQIKGLSKLSYDFYDERHVPSKMRRPSWDQYGRGGGAWGDRPGADKFFPEIAVPHELQPKFTVGAGQNQSVWGDIYIPLGAKPGPGKNLRTLLTVSTQKVAADVPRVNIAANWYEVADTGPFQQAADRHLAVSRNAQYQYNGKRPASGSFAVEDDGVSPRMLGWAQWKKGIVRWFFWESTYYLDFQTKAQQVNVWTNPNTYGTDTNFDPSAGRTGFNYSNGDGVLFYPGTDKVFPEASLGANGPISSLRLKYWRRGIQDADCIALAYAVDPVRTREIVNRMVPKVLWEVGVETAGDPTWKRADISWSIDPDAWESARNQLADIIGTAAKPKTPNASVR